MQFNHKTIELAPEAREAFNSFKNPSALQIACGVATFAGGFQIANANRDLVWLGVILGAFGAVFAVFSLFDYIGNLLIVAEWHRAHLNAFIAKTNAQYQPREIVQVPAPRIPFPPVRFIEFLVGSNTRDGKLPTVEQCAQAGFTTALAQKWFEQMVSAGAIAERVPFQSAGRIADGWSPARLTQAAIDDNKVTK